MQLLDGDRRHYTNIITFIERPLTNAVGEGINRIIKITKNLCAYTDESREKIILHWSPLRLQTEASVRWSTGCGGPIVAWPTLTWPWA
jgi:hypothetical protein